MDDNNNADMNYTQTTDRMPFHLAGLDNAYRVVYGVPCHESKAIRTLETAKAIAKCAVKSKRSWCMP